MYDTVVTAVFSHCHACNTCVPLQVYQYCIYVNYSSELLSQPNPEVPDDVQP